MARPYPLRNGLTSAKTASMGRPPSGKATETNSNRPRDASSSSLTLGMSSKGSASLSSTTTSILFRRITEKFRVISTLLIKSIPSVGE